MALGPAVAAAEFEVERHRLDLEASAGTEAQRLRGLVEIEAVVLDARRAVEVVDLVSVEALQLQAGIVLVGADGGAALALGLDVLAQQMDLGQQFLAGLLACQIDVSGEAVADVGGAVARVAHADIAVHAAVGVAVFFGATVRVGLGRLGRGGNRHRHGCHHRSAIGR